MTARDAHNLHESSYQAQWLFGTAQGEVLWDFRDGVLTLVDDGGVRTPYDAAEVVASPVFARMLEWYRSQEFVLEDAA
jgi:hypothetical protein